MTEDNDASNIITNALTDWLATRGGGIVTSFAICAEYVDSDGDRSWLTLNAEKQCVEFMFAEDDDD